MIMKKEARGPPLKTGKTGLTDPTKGKTGARGRGEARSAPGRRPRAACHREHPAFARRSPASPRGYPHPR